MLVGLRLGRGHGDLHYLCPLWPRPTQTHHCERGLQGLPEDDFHSSHGLNDWQSHVSEALHRVLLDEVKPAEVVQAGHFGVYRYNPSSHLLASLNKLTGNLNSVCYRLHFGLLDRVVPRLQTAGGLLGQGSRRGLSSPGNTQGLCFVEHQYVNKSS